MEELVSVIVPIFNASKYVKQCFDCIQKQNYQNLEIIFVDDGSTDQSGTVCDELAKKDDRIKVIHKENGGPCSTRNAGLKIATGKYIFFYDVDDYISDGLISENVSFAEKNQSDVVFFGFRYFNLDTNEEKINAIDGFFEGTEQEFFEKRLIEMIEKEIFNAPWNKLYRRDVLEKNHIDFDERFPGILEDQVFNARILNYADRITVNPKVYYTYYVRSEGSQLSRFQERFLDSINQYHHNANEYCIKHKYYHEQIKIMEMLYLKDLLGYLKQISVKDDLPYQKKIELIKRITNDETMRSTLKYADFTDRKKIVIFCLDKKLNHSIIFFFRTLNLLRRIKK